MLNHNKIRKWLAWNMTLAGLVWFSISYSQDTGPSTVTVANRTAYALDIRIAQANFSQVPSGDSISVIANGDFVLIVANYSEGQGLRGRYAKSHKIYKLATSTREDFVGQSSTSCSNGGSSCTQTTEPTTKPVTRTEKVPIDVEIAITDKDLK